MMDRIDLTNYEAWLLDRLEGNLTPQQERDLDAFLAAHPGLDTGPGELPGLHEPAARLSAADKQALKRTLPPAGLPAEPIDDFLIARLEGDLTAEQQDALRVYLLHHPEHRHAERLYALTKLVPEALRSAGRHALVRQLPPEGIPSRNTLDDFLVARLEGDLTPAQEQALAQLLEQDPGAARAWQLIQRTKVSSGSVVYPEKGALHKGGRVIAWRAARAPWMEPLLRAAAVALLIGLAWWALLPSGGSTDQVAEVPATEPTAKEHQQGTVKPVQDEGALPEDAKEEVLKAAPSPQLAAAKGGVPRTSQRVEAVQPHDPSLPLIPEGGDRQAPPDLEHVPQPRVAEEPVHPVAHVEEQVVPTVASAAAPSAMASQASGIPVGTYLANTVRSRVLDPGTRVDGPLGGEDALALVDKGLRTVTGDQAGLDVARDPDGRMRKFELRLGRNLAVTAHR